MKYAAVSLVAAAGSAAAAVGNVQVAYGQCGGENYSGPTSCTSGWHCTSYNPYYYQCVTGAGPTAVASAPPAATSSPAAAKTTLTTKPSAAPTSVSTTLSTPAAAPKPVASSLSSPAVPSSAAPTTTAPAPAATTTSAAAPAAATTTSAAAAAPAASGAASSGKVKYAGVNISGFDFGCSIDGTCTISSVANPGTTGASQMTHFVSQTGLNAFRLPVAWQYLVNNNLGGTLDATNFGNYDTLVQNCIKAGAALCIVDIHNYARWNGNVIGQSNGAVTDAQFTSLWSQLATKYASSATVAFGIMNEPQGLPSVPTWGQTVQKAVTAIRQAGAKNNMILLPGNDFTHASTYISDGSYAALSNITNLDGSKTNLVFDVHQYLDSDGSGTHANCVTNNVAAFTTLATQLRTDKRQALLSETGGGPTDATCLTNVCQELQYLASNSDVYLGWTGWAAGEFDTSYVLTETPMGSPGAYTDQQLVTQCIAGAFKGTSTA